MKVHPIVFIIAFAISRYKFSNGQNSPRPPNIVINEVKISPQDKYIELRSEAKSSSLDGFQVVVMEFSKEREKDAQQQLKLRGVISLNGKRTSDHLAFIGTSTLPLIYGISLG